MILNCPSLILAMLPGQGRQMRRPQPALPGKQTARAFRNEIYPGSFLLESAEEFQRDDAIVSVTLITWLREPPSSDQPDKHHLALESDSGRLGCLGNCSEESSERSIRTSGGILFAINRVLTPRGS